MANNPIRRLTNKRNLLYYLFAGFIIAIFLWWWTLLFQKNENVYKEKRVLYDLIIDIDPSETTMKLYHQEVARLEQQYMRQKFMITGEGLTFLLLLILGVIRLNIYLRKEIDLARQQSNFLLSITHELKSPLASALLNNQTLLKRTTLPEEKRALLLNNSNAELQRLEQLVEKLLFAARIEGEEITLDKHEIDISDLFERLYEKYLHRTPGKFHLSAEIEPAVEVVGDAVLLTSIFTNLMDNAFKYCPEGGAIDVKLWRENGKAHFTVANDGVNISEKDKQRIWERFYRIGDEQTRSSIGTGLGLYIVKRVVESHDGAIQVADKPGGGVVFNVWLPSIMTPV